MKKRALLMLVCAVALMAVSILGTYAFLTSTDEVTNTFTVGNVVIELDEALVNKTTAEDGTVTWAADGEADRVQANTYVGILPGSVLPKDPIVWNTGDNACYVRVNVVINNYSEWVAAMGATFDFTTLYATVNTTAWTAPAAGVVDATADTITFTYVYNTTLLSSANTGALFTTVTIPNTLTAEQLATLDGFTINVTADAIQADGFESAAAAFTAFDAE